MNGQMINKILLGKISDVTTVASDLENDIL
jgi:hypothetical protein